MSGLQVLAGLGAVLGAAIAGAAVGAAIGPVVKPCTSGQSLSDALACGSHGGAAAGSGYGVLAAGVGGLGVAVFSPTYRTAGVAAAATVAGMLVVGAVVSS